MKNLLFSILTVLSLTGCSPYLFNNYRKPDKDTFPSKSESYSWFTGDQRSFLFNTSIKFYSHDYSSLMVIKPLTTESYRALLVTEMGIKICDLEIFRSGDYKLHYCIEQLNKKSVIKMLADCLGLMVYPVPGKEKLKFLQEKNGDRAIIRSKHKGGLVFSFIDSTNGKANEIKETGYLFKKLEIKLDGSGSVLDSVNITHKVMKLNIHMSKIND